MSTRVTLLGLLTLIINAASVLRTCIPNTQFQMNGHICYCDDRGQWNEANCEISRRKNCEPGQIIWEGCNQCICQENGQLQCIGTSCTDSKTDIPPKVTTELDKEDISCLPFVSYYVNCSLCVCPASGNMIEARCAKDKSCPFIGITDFREAVIQNVCIPKVIYLFPCLQCQCSDKGTFLLDKCVETCHKPEISSSTKRCIPGRYYKNECNICWCLENSIADDDMCSKVECSNRFELFSLSSIKNSAYRCQRNTFTSPKCVFCDCNQNGTVNKNACLELDCANINKLNNAMVTEKCSPGEMVPFCSQCLCLQNGLIDAKYCTDVCSHQQKLTILETVLNDSFTKERIIHKASILAANNGVCEPNSIYLDDNKYCLCPDNGSTKFKLCTSFTQETKSINNTVEIQNSPVDVIDFNAPCDASSFVEFDCNTCYCTKAGKLDPKWCTYDDCEAKRIIQKRHENRTDIPANGSCIAGSLIKEECNFCICPSNGQLKDKTCTKNSCADLRNKLPIEKFSCNPLEYYNVDCNTCFCPENGLKNLVKCTKNICEKSFLRSMACIPGELFSDDCNVCICPPSGDKSDRVCTNYTCSDAYISWKKIFKLSESLLSNLESKDTKTSTNLELCFPGEEYEVGCNVCVCPEMGLRIYASCTHMLCGDDRHKLVSSDDEPSKIIRTIRTKRNSENANCFSYNVTDTFEYKCTPGSMYIIRCRQCICPYKGSIHHFCRPLPIGTYCEQPFPGVNYMPMGRKTEKKNTTALAKSKEQLNMPHNHTAYSCDKPGRVTDECYICDCENNFIIEEHCFKRETKKCSELKPSFLDDNKRIV